jgi:hypothetical protein
MKKQKPKKERNFRFNVTLKFTQVMPGINVKEAKEKTKSTFKDEFNLEITDQEIKHIKQKSKKNHGQKTTRKTKKRTN